MGSRANKYLIAITDGHPALQDELTGTENRTNAIFLYTTVDDGDHFQPECSCSRIVSEFGGTLKSRWQQPRTLSELR
jgi:hypothetical protein